MDSPPASPEARYDRQWAPPLAAVIVGWLVALVALYWCVLGSGDAAGRLLAGVTVLVVGGAAMFGSRARPRLTAGREGLLVRGLLRAETYEWARVLSIRLVHTRRFGRDVPSLEIEVLAGSEEPDGPERLLVFGWLELGTDPSDVAEALHPLRPA